MIKLNFITFNKTAAAVALVASSWVTAQSLPKFDRTFQAMYTAQKEGKVSDIASSKIPGLLEAKATSVMAEGAEVYYNAIIYAKDPSALQAAGIKVQSVLPKFATALVTLNDLERLAKMDNVLRVKAPKLLYPTNDITVAQTGASLLQAGVLNNTVYKGKGVLVGIFDSGNYFKHPDFRDAADQTKSRILKMWDQTITPTGTEASPSGFTYGVEYTQQQISNEINGVTTGAVREADTNGHGTHVAGTAAGNGVALPSKKYAGMAPEASYIIVKGGNGSFSQTHIIDGLSYFNKVATALNMPIVVNMSVGGQYGPHDGTGDEETAVDNFSKSGSGRVVAIAAGNDNGSNIHRQIVIPAGGTASVSFTVPTNTTADYLFGFLLYGSNNSNMSATITDPSGNTANVATNSSNNGTNLGTGFTYYADDYVDPNNKNRYIDNYIARVSGTSVDAAGTWTLTFKNEGTAPTTADGWLYDQNDEFDNKVPITVVSGDSNYLVGSPGDAKTAVTVAAYTAKIGWYSNNTSASGGYAYTDKTKRIDGLSTFSSNGPLRDGSQKPDIAAPGEAVISTLSSGVITAGSSSNVDGKYYQVMSGTSMATPATAGAIALILQAKPTATYSDIKTLLAATAAKDNATGTALPSAGWGAGKLDVFQAVASITGANRTRKTYINETYPYAQASDAAAVFSTERLAERFTPDLTGFLGGVYFGTSSTFTGLTSYTIEVWNSSNGTLGTMLKSKTIDASYIGRYNWNYFDLSDLKVPVTSGQDYYIVLYTAGTSQQWSLRTQSTNLESRSLKSKDNGATWTADTVGYRIRSVVYSGAASSTVDAPLTTEVSLYPNPAVNVLNIQLSNNETSTIKIYDMSGRLVKQLQGNSSTIEVNVSGFAKGEYLINIVTPSRKITKKFLKQ